MKNIRRSVFQGMVTFVQRATLYDLENIAKVIQEPYQSAVSIMQSLAYPINHRADFHLAKLYAIALDLSYLQQGYDDENL